MADSKSQRFIPTEVFRQLFDKQLSAPQLLVLFTLASYGKNGIENIYPSIERIGRDANYHRSSVERILRELEKIGVLIREGKKGLGVVVYRINLDALPEKSEFKGMRQKRQRAKKKPNRVESSELINSRNVYEINGHQYGCLCDKCEIPF